MPKLYALALLGLVAAAPGLKFNNAGTVKVTLADYSFSPSTIRLRAGQPVILRLVNTADQPHEFAAPDFFRNASVLPSDAALVNREGEAEVQPHKQVDIALIPKPGVYRLQCNKPGHLAHGMVGSIVVG